jgi:hypothetical protein
LSSIFSARGDFFPVIQANTDRIVQKGVPAFFPGPPKWADLLSTYLSKRKGEEYGWNIFDNRPLIGPKESRVALNRGERQSLSGKQTCKSFGAISVQFKQIYLKS